MLNSSNMIFMLLRCKNSVSSPFLANIIVEITMRHCQWQPVQQLQFGKLLGWTNKAVWWSLLDRLPNSVGWSLSALVRLTARIWMIQIILRAFEVCYWPRSTVNNKNLCFELRENYSQVGYFQIRNDLSIKVKTVFAVNVVCLSKALKPNSIR